jgi:GMP synthase (glutamine-hydrolysing)
VDKVAILDCGGQYTKVIDRRVREQGVYTVILPGTTPAQELKGFSALILSGGPSSVYDPTSIQIKPEIFALGLPVLAICYGLQFLVHANGGTIQRGNVGEYGVETLEIQQDNALLGKAGDKTQVLMSHFDVVSDPGAKFEVLGRTHNCIAMVRHRELPIYGVQFHPEVDLTEQGPTLLRNFLLEVAKINPSYTLDTRIEEATQKIKSMVKDSKVVVLVSGGVDSAVTLVLLHKALSDEQIIAIHVDNGFMRKDESKTIKTAFDAIGFHNLIVLDSADYFINTPITDQGQTYPDIFHVADPELRRRVIGQRFVEVAETKLKSLNLALDDVFLAQGTLRPDLIESGNPDVSKFAHTIKTHHNDVALIRTLRAAGKVIETNSEWHKDEVRQVARMLDLPESLAGRQPFPGPGLAIRFIGSAEAGPVRDLGAAAGGYHVFGTSLRAVGVQGDERSYRNVAILKPGVPAAQIDWPSVVLAARSFTNQNPSFNRVIVPLTDEVEVSGLKVTAQVHDAQSLDLLRDVDDFFVRRIAGQDKISQGLVVLVPIGSGKRFSVVIRAIVTNDFMTGHAAVPGKEFLGLPELAADMARAFPELEGIFYDITGKPPATVEWL